MRTTSWRNFYLSPRKYLWEKKLKVRFKNGSYFVVQYYTNIVEERGRRIRGKAMRHECYICKNIRGSVFVIPYDGSFPPGYYCTKCKHNYNIMDVAVAKHYGKIT